jgi:hypothetical protein
VVWLLYGAATGIGRFDVLNVPAGAKIELSCRGPGCPLRSPRVLRVSQRTSRVALAQRALKRARFRHGAVLKVVITKPGMIGRVASWTFSRTPRRLQAFPVQLDRCLPPGATRAVRCTS